MRKRLRPNSKTLQGEKALQERWYADVPTLPSEKASMYNRVPHVVSATTVRLSAASIAVESLTPYRAVRTIFWVGQVPRVLHREMSECSRGRPPRTIFC